MKLPISKLPLEWKVYLNNLAISNLTNFEREKWLSGFQQLWLPTFASYGINLGDVDKINVTHTSKGWQITPSKPESVEISIKPANSKRTIRWTISAPITYLVWEDSESNQLVISYQNDSVEETRSDFGDRHFFDIESNQAKTGKIAAIFLEGKIKDKDKYITTQQYKLEVIHLGQMWTERGIKQVQSRKLNSNRIFLIPPDTNCKNRLQQESPTFREQGDPDPYSVQGNPLSGTTVLRLIPNPELEAIESVKLKILYSYVE